MLVSLIGGILGAVKLGSRLAKLHISDSAFLGILLAGSLCLNVGLGWKVRRLTHPAEVHDFAVTGVTLSSLLCTDLEGKPHIINFAASSKPTVLYIVHPKCPWCARNLENIKTLAGMRSNSFQFIGLSLYDPSLRSYVESNGMGLPVYSISSFSAVRELKLGSTPETIVVEPGGKVVKNWIGAFMGSRQKEVEA